MPGNKRCKSSICHKEAKNCNHAKYVGVPGLGRAEQYSTLSMHLLSCLYSPPDASLASVKVWRIEYSSPVAGNFGDTTHQTKSPVKVGDPKPKIDSNSSGSISNVKLPRRRRITGVFEPNTPLPSRGKVFLQ